MATNSLYQQVGGAEAVKLLVIKLYSKILQDELLMPFFENVSVERLRISQHAFITVALGGPNNYNGSSMRQAHKALVLRGLNDTHFNAVKNHMMTSMQELGVANDIIRQALEIVESTRNDVLNHPPQEDING